MYTRNGTFKARHVEHRHVSVEFIKIQKQTCLGVLQRNAAGDFFMVSILKEENFSITIIVLKGHFSSHLGKQGRVQGINVSAEN